MTRIGVISDTHDLIRPEALAALAGSELIIHAGDICAEPVLAELRKIARVIAVRGNNDRGSWAQSLAVNEVVEVGGKLIYVLHNLDELDLDAKAAGFSLVITGHSHAPSLTEKDGVMYLNPGSAGPRRFSLPISLAKVFVTSEIRAELVRLD